MTAPLLVRVPDLPVDLDAVETIVRMGRAGTFTPAETRMRLRQVIG